MFKVLKDHKGGTLNWRGKTVKISKRSGYTR